MRPTVLALVAAGLASAGCSSPGASSCPGVPVAALHIDGTLASAAQLAADPAVAPLDPAPALPDCTPAADSAIQYPPAIALDATLSQDPAGSGAALCRSNGVVYSGERTGASSYVVSAEADPAVLCSGACAATLDVVIAGDVTVDPGGAPATFQGIVVEFLTASRGACDACLPLVPGSDPPVRACAARYRSPPDPAPSAAVRW